MGMADVSERREEKFYELTKEEICRAIVSYIGKAKDGSVFFPYRIVGADPKIEIPERVNFRISLIPRGAYRADYPQIL